MRLSNFCYAQSKFLIFIYAITHSKPLHTNWHPVEFSLCFTGNVTLKFESSRFRDICTTINSQRVQSNACERGLLRSTSASPWSLPVPNPNQSYKRSISSPACIQEVLQRPLPPIPSSSSFPSLEDIYVSSSSSVTSMELQTYEDCDTLYYSILPSLHRFCVDGHSRGFSGENLSSGSASLLSSGSAPPSPGSDNGSHFSWDIESFAELPIVLQTFRMAQQQQQQLEEQQQHHRQQYQGILKRRRQEGTQL